MEANKTLNFLFELRDTTHVMHLQTVNYNDHKVLNDFYDGILCLADSFAEQYQGYTGEVITSIGSITVKEGAVPLTYLKDALVKIEEYHKECEIIGVKLVLESIMQLLNSTIYLLNLK